MKPLTINDITKEFAFLLSKEDIPKEKLEDYNVMQKCVSIRVRDEFLEYSLELFSDKFIKSIVNALVSALKSEDLILLYDIDWGVLGDNSSIVKLGLGDSVIDIRGTEGANIIYNGVEHIMRFDVMCKEGK